ncbi:MAG TPA: hypothetical protein DEQ40_07785 [Oxalobacteraceae bacterium]|jgi:hypothetical protein|nr:hypothetical protein [Oxalobacteraceae bacterium]
MTISPSAKQKTVLFGMSCAAAVTFCVLFFAAFHMPNEARLHNAQDALRWLVLFPLPLMICITALARHRFFNAQDIDGSGLTRGTERAVLLQAILQNTLEQTVLASLTYIGFLAVSPPPYFGVMPSAVVLFLAGRLAFAWGYASGAGSRAFGFALTFYPTVVLCASAALLFLARIIKH